MRITYPDSTETGS